MGTRTAPALALALLATLLAGCVTYTVHSWPSRIRERAGDLQTHGRARIETLEHGPYEVRASTPILISQRDGNAKITREITIGELVAGCDPASTAPDPDCLADHVVEQDTVVGEKRERRVGAAIASCISTATGAGLVGLCIVECDGKDVAIGAGLLVGGLIIFAFGFALH